MGDITKEIEDYRTKAESFELSKADLIARIKSLIISEIIPNLTLYLPEHYSISAEKSKVLTYKQSNFVPVAFQINLRLLYDKKPVRIEDDGKLVTPIYHKLEPKLDEMAKKYGLAAIVLVGAPTEIS